MILILEIAIVVAAFVALLATAAMLGRSAMAFGRTAKKAQSGITPRVDKLAIQADTASKLGIRVQERAEELQRRGAVLSLTMDRMKVIVAAAAEAKQRLDRVTGYVGL